MIANDLEKSPYNKSRGAALDDQTWRYLRLLFYTCLIAYVIHTLGKWIARHGDKPVFARKSKQPTSMEQYGAEYPKLLVAVLGDHRVAARLINHEHSIAGPAGIGKAEAVRRALLRLSTDRGRVN